MTEDRRPLLPRIAEFRRVSNEFLLAESVIDAHRHRVEASAVELGLLDRERPDWRARQARAEITGGIQLARAAGLSWSEVVRLARTAVAEVRYVELQRSR